MGRSERILLKDRLLAVNMLAEIRPSWIERLRARVVVCLLLLMLLLFTLCLVLKLH